MRTDSVQSERRPDQQSAILVGGVSVDMEGLGVAGMMGYNGMHDDGMDGGGSCSSPTGLPSTDDSDAFIQPPHYTDHDENHDDNQDDGLCIDEGTTSSHHTSLADILINTTSGHSSSVDLRMNGCVNNNNHHILYRLNDVSGDNNSDSDGDGDVGLIDDSLYHIDGVILDVSSSGLSEFSMDPPVGAGAGSQQCSLSQVCEVSSRLLVTSLHWLRTTLTPFTAAASPPHQAHHHHLPLSEQISILCSSWVSLFVLGLIQCSHITNLQLILNAVITYLHQHTAASSHSHHTNNTGVGSSHMSDTSSGSSHSLPVDSHSSSSLALGSHNTEMLDRVHLLQHVSTSVRQLDLDDTEWAYIKALLVLSPENGSMRYRRQLKHYQDRLLSELEEYSRRSNKRTHVSTILVRVAPLRRMETSLIEELFFSGLSPQTIHISTIIPSLLRMDTNNTTPTPSPTPAPATTPTPLLTQHKS